LGKAYGAPLREIEWARDLLADALRADTLRRVHPAQNIANRYFLVQSGGPLALEILTVFLRGSAAHARKYG